MGMSDFCFRPGAVTVSPGDTVELRNDDPVLHNLYGPGWFAGDVWPGEVVTRTFDDPGTYTFACTLHVGMTGAVVVSDVEPIAATSPIAGDGSGIAAGVLAGIGVALLLGLGSGWILGWVTRRPSRTMQPASSADG